MRRVALIALLALAASACTLDVNIGIRLTETGSGTVTVDIVADEEFHRLHEITGRQFEDLVASRGADVGLAFTVTPGASTRYSAASNTLPANTLVGILEGLAPGIGEVTIASSTAELAFDAELNPLTEINDVAPFFTDADPSQFADDVTVTVEMDVPGDISTTSGSTTGPGELAWTLPFSDAATRLLVRSTLVEESSGPPWTAIAIIGTLALAFGFLVAVRSRFTPEDQEGTSPRPIPTAKSTAPEDQPVALDETPPEDQPIEPPPDPVSD